jgi:hypothetical protein
LKFLALDLDNMTRVDAEIEVQRLRDLVRPLKLGRAIIKRSSDKSRHLIFPEARLDDKTHDALVMMSRSHEGWKQFTFLVDDACYRWSKKHEAEKPYIEEVLEDG